MSRFLSRADWPLIVCGVLAGVLTSGLVLYVFFTGIGGGNGAAHTSLVGDSPEVVATAAGRERDGTTRGRGVIGNREAGVTRRLADMRVPVQPLRAPLSIRAGDVVWNERSGVRFARVEAASGTLQSAGLARGDVVIDDVVLNRPVVALREDAGGGWNYERVLAELLDDGGDGNGNGRVPRRGGKPTIQLRRLRVVAGQADVQRPTERFALSGIDGQLSVVSFSQPGIADPYIRITRLSAVYDQPEKQTRVPIAVTDGMVAFPTGRARFELASLSLDAARVTDVRGLWDPAEPGYGVTATGRAVGMRFEDIHFLAPDRLPESGTATFTWSVRPAAPNATDVSLTQLDASSGESRVRGDVAFRIAPESFVLRDADLRLDPLELSLVEQFAARSGTGAQPGRTAPLPYGGTLSGRVLGTGGDIRFDLTARLTTKELPQPFTALVSGRVRLEPSGVVIQEVDVGLDRVPVVALRALAPGLPFSGVVTGKVSLRGPPNRAPLELDVRLELGTGVAVVAGTLDLTRTVPSYDLTGSLLNVDLNGLLEPEVPPVFLTAGFALEGTGTDPANLDARLQLAGRFTGWETTSRDTINLTTTIRGGTAFVESLLLRLATAAVDASGEWRFVEPLSGAVTYRLAVTDLRPFGPYFPVIGDTIATGALNASGTLAGSLDRMRLAGELTGSDLRVGGWRTAGLATSYDVTVGAAVPTALVELDARAIETPTTGAYNAARLSLRLTPPQLNVQLMADRVTGGQVELIATGQIPLTGERLALVERARVDMQEGRWLLARPTAIRWGGTDGLTVQNLELANETTQGRLLLDGRILPVDRAEARVQFAAFPVGDLLHLLGQEARVEGSLFAEGSVRGGEAPTVDLDFRVEGGSLEQVPMQRMDGRVAYRDRLAQLQVRIAMDTAGFMELNARLPSVLTLTGQPDFDLIDDAPLDGAFTASRFTLAPFRGMVPRVRDLRGYIDGSARLAGTADRPRLEGTLALQNGHVAVPELNQSYTEITGRIGFSENRLVLEELRARSDGWLVARGDVLLESLTKPVLNATVDFTGFRPVGVEDQRDAAVSGAVAIAGPPDALVITGQLRVEDGYVVLPQLGGGLNRELLDITRPAPVMGQQIQTATSETWLRNLRVDNLRVEVADNTWFMAAEARVQLGGELIVSKVGDATPITGTLSGTRGEYTLVAGPIVRRFNIVSGQVRFLGSPTPNPAIDFTARRVIVDQAGREVDVDVRITGALDNYTIQLASGELGALPESELLSFLLFGQPSFALGGDFVPGDDLLQQTFFGGFTELAALELERSLGGLGFDIFQIRWGAGPYGGIGSPTIVIGRQIAPDVFLTVESGLTALFDDGNGSALTSWAARLDWTFDRRSRARLALEPVHRGRSLRGIGRALPVTPPTQQLLIEVRRRWAW